MRTRSNLWVFVSAAALLFLGITTREPRLLALLLPLLAFLAFGTLFTPRAPSVHLGRAVATDTTYEGEEVSVDLTLENRGKTVSFLEVFDTLPPAAEVTRGTNHLILQLPQGESTVLTYRVKFGVKGRYVLGPVVLRSRDPLGLYLRERTVDVQSPVIVSPRAEDLRRVSVFPRRTRPRLGRVSARVAGLGSDFWSIREYQAGDGLRQINWKASARLDDLLSNEKEAERSGDVILVLDARQEANVGVFQRNTVDLGVKAAVSLAAKLLHDRNRVGIVVQREILDWVYPRFGRKQLYRIIDALLSVRPGGQWPFRHIAWVLKRHFPPKSLLILISPLVDRRAVDVVVDLRARGFDIMLLSPSPLELEKALLDGGAGVDYAYRVLRVRRDANVAYLRRFAHVVDWDPNEPLSLALKELSQWPPHLR